MEGDAGASRLNPPGGQERSDPGERIHLEPDTSDESDAQSDRLQDQPAEAEAGDGADEQVVEDKTTAEDDVTRRPERFGRGWLVAICLALLVLAGGVGFGGYLALKTHDQ